jgi:hypothetical protein
MRAAMHHWTRLVRNLSLFALLPAVACTSPEPTRLEIDGHIPEVVTGQDFPPVDSVDPSTTIELVIGLESRNEAEREQLMRDLYDPSSPRFHEYLTPDDYTAQFAPTTEDYQRVVDFAKQHGLEIVETVADRKLVRVRGSVEAINRAFHIELQQYEHPTEKRLFYAPDREPTIDVNLPISHITGLDDYYRPQRKGDVAPHAGGSAPGGGYTGKDFRNAYAPGVTLTGAGQTVGILEVNNGYKQSDINTYAQVNGMPTPSLQNVNLAGFTGSVNNEESTGDVEFVLSMAPAAKVVVYGTPYNNTGIITALHEMANPTHGEPRPNQISTSYYFYYDKNVYDSLAQLALQGQALFVASGDWGAYNETTGSGAFPPADHPLVTSVGGTVLSTGTGGAWASETTWSSSGGGYSPWGADSQFALPWWQRGMDFAAFGGSSTVRNGPDVAAIASNIGYIYNGSWSGFAGTSASAPLWAGFMALVNQRAAQMGRPAVGFANPAIYGVARSGACPTCFHDVTTGNNASASGTYYAKPGFDLTTGWGSPNGQTLINALAAYGKDGPAYQVGRAAAIGKDGRIDAFVLGSDHAVWHVKQTSPNGGWGSWQSLGGNVRSTPTVGRNQDGRLEMLVVGFNNHVYHKWQDAYGNWSDWADMGGSIAGVPIVARNLDGHLEVFARGTDNAIWHCWQVAPNSGWSGWASFGGGVTGNPAVMIDAAGRLDVFARGTDGAIWHVPQLVPNANWGSWQSLGGGLKDGPAVGRNADGAMVVVAVGTDSRLYHNDQRSNGTWTGWQSFGVYAQGVPAIGRNADGRLEVIAVDLGGSLGHVWQYAPNGSYSGWASYGGTTSSRMPDVAINQDGRMEVFTAGVNDRVLYHAWQTAPSSGWSGWAPFSGISIIPE